MSSREIVLIYQMGKVGSQTVDRTVRSVRPDAEIVRTHFLSADQYDRLSTGADDVTPEFLASVLHQKREALALLALLQDQRQDVRLKLITACREPVAHCIAGCFQNLDVLLPGYGAMPVDDSVGELRSLLLSTWRAKMQKLPARTARERLLYRLIGLAASWFSEELRAVLDIDVFDMPFVPGEGPVIFSKNNIDALLYRIEDGTPAIEQGVARLFSAESVTVLSENLSSDKNYHVVYSAFRNTANLPASFLDEQYASQYARHFYSAVEISRFRAGWCAPGPGPCTDPDSGPLSAKKPPAGSCSA